MTLSTLQTPSGRYTIAPFDHRGSLIASLGLNESHPDTTRIISEIKVMMMEAFSPLCSGVLVDPIYGFESIEHKAHTSGLILSLEQSGYHSDPSAMCELISGWGIAHCKANYAVPKFLLQYHPQEKHAVAKRTFVHELALGCRQEGVSFLLEPLVFNPVTLKSLSGQEHADVQLEMIKEFRNSCDIIKIAYPGDALSCATVSAQLDIPWILLSRGMVFEQYLESVQVAMENGCSGFAAGRAIWQELSTFQISAGQPDLKAIKQFLFSTATERLKKLIAVIEK